MKYSDEQLLIIEKLKDDSNIIVNAVAGSGKTTTSMLIASSFPTKKVLLLTFNKRLSDESVAKKKELGIENIDVHTFHGFFSKYYRTACYNDKLIKEILAENKEASDFFYDIIIIDEAQDINMTVYECLIKTLANKCKNTNICVFGDERQAIYQFLESSSNFLIKADVLFDLNDKKWTQLNLSESFRLTNEMTKFLNDVYIRSNYIKSNKQLSDSVEYYVLDNAFNVDKVYMAFSNIFEKYKPEDIFVIAPTIKGSGKNPISRFENVLSKNKIPVFKPMSNEEELREEDIKNKLVFSSIHQAKGRERKVVFLFGADQGYFDWFARNLNSSIFPNTMYVAMSRALEKLIIITDIEKSPFSFTNLYELQKYYSEKSYISFTEYIENTKIIKKDNSPSEYVTYTVVKLIRFVSTRHIYDLLSEVKWDETIINTDYKLKHTKSSIECDFDGTTINEPTNIFNGIFFPLYFRFSYKNNAKQLEDYVKLLIELAKLAKNNKEELYHFLSNSIGYLEQILEDINSKENLLKLSVVLASQETSQISRINQIDKYDWVGDEDKQKTSELLDSLISKNSVFEKTASFNIKLNDIRYTVNGLVDCIDHDNKTVWEFKFSKQISINEQLQLICYRSMLINEDEKYKDYSYKILNIRNSKVYKMNTTDEIATKIIEKLIKLKFESESADFNVKDSELFKDAFLLYTKYVKD